MWHVEPYKRVLTQVDFGWSLSRAIDASIRFEAVRAFITWCELIQEVTLRPNPIKTKQTCRHSTCQIGGAVKIAINEVTVSKLSLTSPPEENTSIQESVKFIPNRSRHHLTAATAVAIPSEAVPLKKTLDADHSFKQQWASQFIHAIRKD